MLPPVGSAFHSLHRGRSLERIFTFASEAETPASRRQLPGNGGAESRIAAWGTRGGFLVFFLQHSWFSSTPSH